MTTRRALGFAATALGGFLIAGLLGLALGVIATLTASDQRPWLVQLTRGSPIILLVISALATMFEAPIDRGSLGSDYAAARDLASTSSQLAIIIVLALVVVAAGTVLGSQPDPAAVAAPGAEPVREVPPGPVAPAEPDVAPRATPSVLELAMLATAAGIVRIILAPGPLSGIGAEIASAVERGTAYGRWSGTSFEETAWVAPLAPITAAFTPLGAKAALVGIGTATVLAIAVIGYRLGGPSLGRWAGLLAASAPVLWSQQLPAALVSATACAAVLAYDLDERRARAPWIVGVCCGLGLLASPAALVALIAIGAMAATGSRRRDTAAIVLGALLVIAPWQVWVHQNFSTILPTTGVAPTLVAATEPEVRWGSDIGTVAAFTPPAPLQEAAANSAAVDRFVGRIGWHLLPPVVVARAVRAVDVWAPNDTVGHRDARGLPNPGGIPAATLSGLISIAALVGVLRWGRTLSAPSLRWFLAASLIGAGLTYGEREVAAAGTPVLIVCAAFALSGWVARLRRSQERSGSTPTTGDDEGDDQAVATASSSS